MLTSLFVLARIVSNPLANVFQKQLAQRASSPIFVIAVVHALLTVVSVPLILAADLDLRAGMPLWLNMALCAVLAVTGNAILIAAMESTDLSILGPINAYKSVVGLILGTVLIGERPTAIGAAGVLLILAGSYLVADRGTGQRRHAFVQFFRERGIQLRFAALGLSATEAVFLKKAILLSSPLTTFVLWSMIGLPIAVLGIFLLPDVPSRKDIAALRVSAGTFLWLALATGIMQLTTVLTFGKLQVGYSLALFQMSTLITVFLGHRYFQEPHIRTRLAGSIVMAGGAGLIVAFGRR